MEWRAVKNYENLYEVSSTGLVRSVDRTIVQKIGVTMFYPSKVLKPDTTGNRTVEGKMYNRVTLSKEHVTARKQVHQLVALAYMPNPDNKPHVNHIDNNPENNNVDNLEWVTHSENMKHAQKQGRLLPSQSKGGQTLGAGITSRIANENAYITGQTFGIFKILKVYYDKSLRQPWRCEIQCQLCGATQHTSKQYAKNSIATYCKYCKR